MHDVQYYKSIFDKYGGMMRTTQDRGRFPVLLKKVIFSQEKSIKKLKI